MTDIAFTTGQVAHVPLLFTDANGLAAAAPTDGAVSVDNLAIATAVLSSPTTLDITGLTVGAATLTYTGGAGTVTGTLTITLTAAAGGVAANVAFDVANATFTPAI